MEGDYAATGEKEETVHSLGVSGTRAPLPQPGPTGWTVTSLGVTTTNRQGRGPESTLRMLAVLFTLETGSCPVTMLEGSGAVTGHCSLELLGSSIPPTSSPEQLEVRVHTTTPA